MAIIVTVVATIFACMYLVMGALFWVGLTYDGGRVLTDRIPEWLDGLIFIPFWIPIMLWYALTEGLDL